MCQTLPKVEEDSATDSGGEFLHFLFISADFIIQEIIRGLLRFSAVLVK